MSQISIMNEDKYLGNDATEIQYTILKSEYKKII